MATPVTARIGLPKPDAHQSGDTFVTEFKAAMDAADAAIVRRSVTVADAASITPNCALYDCINQVNTQGAGTLTINAPTGTPLDFQRLEFRLSATAAQTFSWNAAYAATVDWELPTTLGAGAKVQMVFTWDDDDDVWYLVGQTNVSS